MKEINATVPDEVARAACIRATNTGTSIDAPVNEYLRTFADKLVNVAELVHLQDRIIDQIHEFSATDRVSRDEIHLRGST